MQSRLPSQRGNDKLHADVDSCGGDHAWLSLYRAFTLQVAALRAAGRTDANSRASSRGSSPGDTPLRSPAHTCYRYFSGGPAMPAAADACFYSGRGDGSVLRAAGTRRCMLEERLQCTCICLPGAFGLHRDTILRAAAVPVHCTCSACWGVHAFDRLLAYTIA